MGFVEAGAARSVEVSEGGCGMLPACDRQTSVTRYQWGELMHARRWRLGRAASLLLPAIVAWAATVTALASPEPERTDVLVVGTIHDRHARNVNYSYEHVARILDTFDPDALCVEIRPEDFRRKPYLEEMMLATVWGVTQGRPVYPVDWWGQEDDRQARAELARQPEFQKQAERFERLMADDPTILAFQRRYGDFDHDDTLGFRFWNGDDYARYFTEYYRLSLEVYGDSSVNLHYVSRNNQMLGLIRAAVARRPVRKVAVLTGSEHKHFFDRELAGDSRIRVVSLESILPLSEAPLAAPLRAFLDEGDDLAYYEKGAVQDINEYYTHKLLPLVHSWDMDFKPEIIPEKNIAAAERILSRWKRTSPPSSTRQFEEAWLSFLRHDYDRAIELYRILASGIDAGTVTKAFHQSATFVNLGRCYDLQGERERALSAYRRVDAILRQQGRGDKRDFVLQDYMLKPYEWPGESNR
jgi:tetratricopeptide (TPR) repeat protein